MYLDKGFVVVINIRCIVSSSTIEYFDNKRGVNKKGSVEQIND